MSKDFTADDFKQLARSLIAELRTTFGASYEDHGVRFDFDEYAKVIETTTVEFSLSPLYAQFPNNQEMQAVHALNYFPENHKIILYAKEWKKLFSNGQIFDLQLMIHHEFVPYFKKKADWNLTHNSFVALAHQSKKGWESIKDGFYQQVTQTGSFLEGIPTNVVLLVEHVSTGNDILITTAQHPTKDWWCPVCFVDLAQINLSPVPSNRTLMLSGLSSLPDSEAKVLNSSAVQLVYKSLGRSLFGISFRPLESHLNPINELDADLSKNGMVLFAWMDPKLVNWKKPQKTAMTTFVSKVGGACIESDTAEAKTRGTEVLDLDCKNIPDLYTALGLDLQTCLDGEPTLERFDGPQGCVFRLTRSVRPVNNWYPGGKSRYDAFIGYLENKRDILISRQKDLKSQHQGSPQ